MTGANVISFLEQLENSAEKYGLTVTKEIDPFGKKNRNNHYIYHFSRGNEIKFSARGKGLAELMLNAYIEGFEHGKIRRNNS